MELSTVAMSNELPGQCQESQDEHDHHDILPQVSLSQ